MGLATGEEQVRTRHQQGYRR